MTLKRLIPVPNHVSLEAALGRRKNMCSWSRGESAMTLLHCFETLWSTKRSFNGKYDSVSSRSSYVPKTASDAEWSLCVSFVAVVLRFYGCCQHTATC
jgi:hypothetical protein